MDLGRRCVGGRLVRIVGADCEKESQQGLGAGVCWAKGAVGIWASWRGGVGLRGRGMEVG